MLSFFYREKTVGSELENFEKRKRVCKVSMSFFVAVINLGIPLAKKEEGGKEEGENRAEKMRERGKEE